ncbi:MAG: ATP-binding protein [Tepidisphaeraceae bacterium]
MSKFNADRVRPTILLAVTLAVLLTVVGKLGGVGVTTLAILLSCVAVFVYVSVLNRRSEAAGRRLSEAIDRFFHGDWSARIRPDGEDELANCGFRLNLLAERTDEQIAELHRQVAGLNKLVDSLPDAVLLADAQQRVVRINEPAAKFLSITQKQAAGQKLIAVLGEAALVDAYEKMLAAGEEAKRVVKEIRVMRQMQKLTFQAVMARTAGGGVLIVLRDITELAEAVRMKADFVANASHELRTPIAAIKIAFETMHDVGADDWEQTERCMTIIAGHLRRLEEMLRDLLDLSRAETADAEPDLATVNAPGLLASILNAMGSVAADKGVDLEVEAEPEMTFVSDRKLLELVLKNLVENGIKYTPAGGKVVTTIAREEGGIVIRVADSGIGIPPQHTERVFERFYQVDPARSGSSTGRGTGLGLAIVKHGVANLGGRVTLASVVGRGTTVTCVLPDLPPTD